MVIPVRDVSDAVKVKVPDAVIVTAKLATPPVAVTVPPLAIEPLEGVRTIVSPEPVFVVTRLPYWSSTYTVNPVSGVPAVPVAGGSTL